jgi:hypothetical protein
LKITIESQSLSQFDVQGQSDRRFRFGQNSLALKALQDGEVDFHQQQVKFTGAKIDVSKAQNLLEVDLGEMDSLEQGQVHISEGR